MISQSFYAALIMLVIVTSLAAGTWLGHVVRTGQPLREEDTQPALNDSSSEPVSG